MGEEEDVTSGESIQKRRFRENLEAAKAFLEGLQPGIEYDARGGIVSDPESRVRYAEELRKAGFWTSTVAKLCRLKPANQPKSDEGEQMLVKIEGPVSKSTGYVEELKSMVRTQISRSKELTDAFYNIGLAGLLASLHKSGMSAESFRKIASQEAGLKDALQEAGDTIFKALEYYQSDLIGKVEEERDEARAYVVLTEAKIEEIIERAKMIVETVEPVVRLERMIQTYLLSGKPVDIEVFSALMDKYLSLEMDKLAAEQLERLNKWR